MIKVLPKTTTGVYLGMAIAIVLAGLACTTAISELIHRWTTESAYSHAPLLLLLAAYILFDQRKNLPEINIKYHWTGAIVVVIATALFVIGELSALFIASQYAFILMIIGIFIAGFGVSVLRISWPAFVLLFFTVPLPYFLESGLTASLQLISSQLGVAIIKQFSIPVYLEGNIIDLGIMKLFVVEACAGLRYLFSLMSFGFICAYAFRVELWKRILVFFSTIPITIFMNSFRIALGGILVSKAGIETAQGFFHEFQGLVIFIICLAILFIEMWLLTKIGSGQKAFREVFGLDITLKHPSLAGSQHTPSLALFSTILILAFSIFLFHNIQNREELLPEHKPLARYPDSIGPWQGRHIPIDNKVLNKLKLTDHLQMDFHHTRNFNNPPVTLYIAYYNSQRKGRSPHSPRVCIPGGGWEITQLIQDELTPRVLQTPFRFNRAIIQKGEQKQVVIYWFQQRGHYMANEYLVKWQLLKDTVLLNRSDGALVRLVSSIDTNESAAEAEQRVLTFAKANLPILNDFLPN